MTEIRVVNRRKVVFPESQLVVGNRHVLREEVLPLLDSDDVEEVVVDVSKITYVDASGLGVVVSLSRRARNMAKKLVLLDPGYDIITVLELVGLSGVVNVETSVSAGAE